MSAERILSIADAPKENFSRGLLQVEMPEFGTPIRGKVRDIWIIDVQGQQVRIMVTTDRQSAYDRLICTVPGKGQVLNLLSEYWFENTRDIIPNHMIAVAHPNVIIARQAQDTLPVEVVLRRYMARSSTTTSVYHNYVDRQRREIYGIKFPEGLRANEEFPMGTVLTPTTKAEAGHDEELTDEQALEIVDGKLGDGTWVKAKTAAIALFERARENCLRKGLILVDTKYEFGIDQAGNLMLIDEVHTPDSSRFWLAETYEQRFKKGETPDTFDKEILRRWLSEMGFRGEGRVPTVDPKIIDQVATAYVVPYRMITGKELPNQYPNTTQQVSISDPSVIEESIFFYLHAIID